MGPRGLPRSGSGVLHDVLRPRMSERGGVTKPLKLTPEELAKHLSLLTASSAKDLDELLTDLLCHVYRTRNAQDS